MKKQIAKCANVACAVELSRGFWKKLNWCNYEVAVCEECLKLEEFKMSLNTICREQVKRPEETLEEAKTAAAAYNQWRKDEYEKDRS